jgi:hypothetical protein
MSFRPAIAEKSLVRFVAEIEADAPEPELELGLEPELEDEPDGALLLLLLLQPATSRAAALATTGITTRAPLPDLARERRAAGFMNTSRITKSYFFIT